MTLLQAIILGLTQGLTEFIPVSSSGHLVLLHYMLGIEDGGLAFDVALHIGTLGALLVFFHKDLFELAKSVFVRGEKTRLAWLLLLATIPAVIVGVLLESAAETTFRSPILVSLNLMIVALAMLAAERYARRYRNRNPLSSVSRKQALLIGSAQALAIIPGVSRSGGTITAGIFSGLDRVAATRFSFLLAIPIMIGAIVKVMLDSTNLALVKGEPDMFAVGIATAFISGMLAIRFMLKYLAKRSLNVFAYYRLALGALAILLLLI